MNEKLVCMIVNTTTMAIATVVLFIRLSEFRFDRRKTILAISLFNVLTNLSIMLIAYPNDCNKTTELVLLLGTLPSVIFYFFVSKYRGVRFFTTYCIADVSIALVDFFFYLFALWAFDGNYTITWILRSTAMVLWSVALYFLVGNRYRKALALMQRGWVLMMLCVLGMYVVMSLLSAYPIPIAERPEAAPMAMLVVAMMALTVVIIIHSIYNALEVQEQEQKSQYLHAQLNMAENQYALICENIDQVRKQRHDMKYHMNVMRGLLEYQNYEELHRYLDSFQSELAVLDKSLPLFTQNQTVNILAGYYANRAAEDGIQTEFTIQLPAELPIGRTHLTILLGNLWQNALEACQELPEGAHRRIKTSIAFQHNKFLLKSSNSAVRVSRDAQGRFLSTKGKDRGSGLAGMENIVSLYEGYCECDFDGQEFTFSAVLPLPSSAGGEL